MKTSAPKLQEVSGSVAEIEDLVYNFLMIILEHSLRQKDGWKVYYSLLDCDGDLWWSTKNARSTVYNYFIII